MLKAQPEVARYLHEAHVITRAQLEALEAAGKLVVGGSYKDANALLAQTAADVSQDRSTPLDVVAMSFARKQAIRALRGTAHAAAIAHFEALSLAHREVSAWAETVFVRRAMRLVRLLELDAPASVIESEIELLRETTVRLDSLEPRNDPGEPRFLPDEEIARFSDARFALSLGTFTAVIDEVAEFHQEERPADGSEVFALGGPLLEIDFANPPSALLERAIAERGVWDEGEERASAPQQPYGAWLDWMVLEDVADIDVVREILGVMRADLLEVPHEFREELASSIACEFAPLVTCEDWIPLLDARLVAFEDDLISALEEGLVILSRVRRNLAY
jgi:hypothetical protein